MGPNYEAVETMEDEQTQRRFQQIPEEYGQREGGGYDNACFEPVNEEPFYHTIDYPESQEEQEETIGEADGSPQKPEVVTCNRHMSVEGIPNAVKLQSEQFSMNDETKENVGVIEDAAEETTNTSTNIDSECLVADEYTLTLRPGPVELSTDL